MSADRSPRFLVLAAAVSACLACGCAAAADAVPRALQPFATDGCSLFPDRAPTGAADWCDCCVAHDLAYWRGGTAGQRLAADEALRTCVAKAADDALAQAMFLGVRAGGGPELDTSFRWGYGWPYDGQYHALSASETAQADRLEQTWRARHPVLVCPTQRAAPPASAASASDPAAR